VTGEATPVESREGGGDSNPFVLSARAQPASEARDYFDAFWKAKGADRSKLDQIDRENFDEARREYVRLCAIRLSDPEQGETLDKRHEASAAWADDQAKQGKQVWGASPARAWSALGDDFD
jgi:hypothetical protein